MRYFLACITICLLAISCGPKKQISYNPVPTVQLHQIMVNEETHGDTSFVGASLTVISPTLGIDFSDAVGFDSTERDRRLTAAQPFRIASLTKVYVTTAILRLREKTLLSIEDPISKHISKEHIQILRDGGYNPDAITIRQCLTHRSGLYDYAVGGPEYIREAARDPNKRWTRTEQIQFAMDHGEPQGAPGENEHYSDTGYVLLGEIIERRTNKGLAGGLRELLKFDELGLQTTYLESLEEKPANLEPSVKRYMQETIDASHWDNSVDLYGGGGLVSTTRDLAMFLQHLFNDDIYEKEDTLPVMLLKKEYTSTDNKLPAQRLGFESVVGKKSGLEVYLHTGFWGTIFIHIPKYNCSIAMNDTTDADSEILQQVVDYVKWLGENQ